VFVDLRTDLHPPSVSAPLEGHVIHHTRHGGLPAAPVRFALAGGRANRMNSMAPDLLGRHPTPASNVTKTSLPNRQGSA